MKEVHTSFEPWISVLRIASKYGFDSLRKKAIIRLLLTAPAIDKVVCGHEFGSRELLYRGFTELCRADHPLTLEQGRRLARAGWLDDIILLGQARERRTKPYIIDEVFSDVFDEYTVTLTGEDAQYWRADHLRVNEMLNN